MLKVTSILIVCGAISTMALSSAYANANINGLIGSELPWRATNAKFGFAAAPSLLRPVYSEAIASEGTVLDEPQLAGSCITNPCGH